MGNRKVLDPTLLNGVTFNFCKSSSSTSETGGVESSEELNVPSESNRYLFFMCINDMLIKSKDFLYCPAKRMDYHQLRTIVIGRINCAIIGLWPLSRIILNAREWCFCYSVQTVFPWTNLGNKVQNDDFCNKILFVCTTCKIDKNHMLHNLKLLWIKKTYQLAIFE